MARKQNNGNLSFWQDRQDLAATFRWASRCGLDEGIANHFTYFPPDQEDVFLMNARGVLLSEATASNLLLINLNTGKVLEGDTEPDKTGWNIHTAVHRALPHARCIMHLHPPYGTALASTKGFRLDPIDQNAARFFERTAYDDGYGGIALEDDEGPRIARAFGNDAKNMAMFMANHGVICVGPTIAQAFDRLFYLERACRNYHLACASNRPINVIDAKIARVTAAQWEEAEESSFDFLNQIHTVLTREEPTYCQ